MRTYIAKALQNRSKAIRNAVDKYNIAAKAVDRPTVDWAKVSHYSFLEDFTLLADGELDLVKRPWLGAKMRVALQKYRRITRAKEEIRRLNVEVPRLQTSIIDERVDIKLIIQRMESESSPILFAVQDWWDRRRRAGEHLLARIKQIHRLKGYSGPREPGKRIGRIVSPQTFPIPDGDPQLAERELALISRDDEEHLAAAEDDEGTQMTTRIMDFISDASTQ